MNTIIFNANLGSGAGVLNDEWAYLWQRTDSGVSGSVKAGSIIWIHLIPVPPAKLPMYLEKYVATSRDIRATNLGTIFPNALVDTQPYVMDKATPNASALTMAILPKAPTQTLIAFDVSPLVADPMMTVASMIGGPPVAFPISNIFNTIFPNLPKS
jgi:hypothetical protein